MLQSSSGNIAQLGVLWVLLGLVVLHWGQATGQGIPVVAVQSRYTGPQAYKRLLQNTKTAAAFRTRYTTAPETACRTTGSSLCAAAPSSDSFQTLLIAASPDVYDARADAGDNFNPIGPVKDQRPCQTSVAFAITAAAESAAASALETNGSSISMSQQDLQFCPGLQRGCYNNWDIKSGLDRLVNSTVVDSECLPYTAPQSDDPARLCNYRCRDPPRAIVQGKFLYRPMRDVEDAQKQIRRYGSFITRFNLYPDFFTWLEATPSKDPDAIYTCPNTLSPAADAQAVTVVGYDNIKQSWLVKNSWGPASGDKGFFRVKYGVCGMMAPGDTFGVQYIPVQLKQLDVAAAPPSVKSQSGTCVIYRARKHDYVSKIADRTVVSVGQLLADNTGVIKNLDKSLAGLRLRICGADPATINVPKRSDTPAAASPDPANATVPAPPNSTTEAGKPPVLRTGTAPMISPSPEPDPDAAVETDGNASAAAEQDIAQAEATVLLALKSSLQDPAALATWTEGTAPCGSTADNAPAWTRVYCAPFGDQQQVYLLDLTELGLTGSLSDTVPLGNLTRLQILWLSSNELTGTLPVSWGGISTLQEIKLDSNSLTGPLPAQWSALSRLKKLSLNDNKLSGSCPPEWKDMQDLEKLFLSANSLTGTIPASWSELKNLRSCSVYDNAAVRGCLPFDWNARANPVKLAAGPENPDGTLTLTLSGTCLCGYCKDFASSECEGESVTTCAAGNATTPGASNATDSSGVIGNSTSPDATGTAAPGAVDSNSTDSATGAGESAVNLGSDGSAGTEPGMSPDPSLPTADGGIESSTTPLGGTENGTAGSTPGGTASGSAGNITTESGPAVRAGQLGGTMPGAPGGTMPTATSPGSSPAAAAGSNSSSAGQTSVASVAAGPPANMPSFGGFGSGKPTGSTAGLDPSATLAPDTRKQNFMDVESSSSAPQQGSSGAGPSTSGDLS